jgi:type IV secretion system protein TrbL
VAKCDKEMWEWGYTACKGKEKVGEGIEDFANDQVAKAAQSLSDAAAAMMKWLNTWWMEAPKPDLDAEPINQVIGDLTWYTAAFAILGLLFALGKMILSQDFKTLIAGVQPVVNLIIVTACYATGISLLLTAGDELSTWLLDRAAKAGNSEGDISALAVVTTYGGTLGTGGWLIFALIELLGSIMNFGFMLFRNIILPVLMVFLPTLAAASGTETGKQAFAKANGYLIAFICFKPVAAVIYALGLWFMNTPAISGFGTGDGKVEDLAVAVVNVCTGIGIMILAALALPALIKFVVPVAARGAGGFSGGAALAGTATVAAGAAVIAATGGSGAAAGGGGGAVAAGGKATAAEGGGVATATGAASAPPGGGGPTPSGSSGGGGSTGGPSGSDGSESQTGSQPTGAGPSSEKSPQVPGGSEGAASSAESDGGSSAAAPGAESTGTEPSGSSAAGPGASGGSSSVGDAANVAGLISEGTSGAGANVEKAIEDE